MREQIIGAIIIIIFLITIFQMIRGGIVASTYINKLRNTHYHWCQTLDWGTCKECFLKKPELAGWGSFRMCDECKKKQ